MFIDFPLFSIFICRQLFDGKLRNGKKLDFLSDVPNTTQYCGFNGSLTGNADYITGYSD